MASPRLALDPTPIKGKNSVPQAVSAVAAAEPRRIGRTTLVRLAVYYVIAGAALLGLNRLVAELPTAVSEGSGPFPGWADAALQMISALVLVIWRAASAHPGNGPLPSLTAVGSSATNRFRPSRAAPAIT